MREGGGTGRGSHGHAEAKHKGEQESPQDGGKGKNASQRDAEGNRTGQPRPLAFLTDGRERSLSLQEWPSKGAAKSPATPWRQLHPATGQEAEGWKGRASVSAGKSIPAPGPPAGLTQGGLCANDSRSVSPLLQPAARACSRVLIPRALPRKERSLRILSTVACAVQQDSAVYPSCKNHHGQERGKEYI